MVLATTGITAGSGLGSYPGSMAASNLAWGCQFRPMCGPCGEARAASVRTFVPDERCAISRGFFGARLSPPEIGGVMIGDIIQEIMEVIYDKVTVYARYEQ